MSYSRRRLLRANENIPNSLPRDVPKHHVVKDTGNNSTTSAPETGNTHRQRTDKRFSDSDDLGLFSHVDDIEDTTHSFAHLFFNSRQTPKPRTSAMEIPTSTQPTVTIYPWLNSTNIQNNEAVRENNKNDKGNLSKQERKERRKAKKETRNKHENLDNVDINVNVEGRRRNKWKKNRKEKIREQVQKMCSGDFIGAQGKRCCQKSIKCFGDLPELIDEIETYNNSEDQDDLQRQHVCQHIKNSMLCMGHAMALPVCKSSVTFVHRKLNDTLSDVTKFHAESCQKGSSTPTIIPTTTRHTAPPGGIGSRSGVKPHTHDHTNYAAIVGGVAGGLILVFLIVLLVLLLRKNKSKRPTSEFRVKDVDGDMNLSNGSSRYKNHIGLSRNHSEVYAEIDESSMHSNQSFPDNRPLPSAPSNGPISSDNTGYLTPRGSREALGLPNDRDSGGYHVLQKDPNRKPSVDAYEKLHNEEGEYIEPTNNSDRRVRVPSQKPPKNNNQDVPKPTDDNYHMYFVLEKDSAVHV